MNRPWNNGSSQRARNPPAKSGKYSACSPCIARLPSFNACRETCRELAYHYNLLVLEPDHPEADQRARMMGWVANHLFLFISGKMETEQLGDFCCASKPVRETVDAEANAQ